MTRRNLLAALLAAIVPKAARWNGDDVIPLLGLASDEPPVRAFFQRHFPGRAPVPIDDDGNAAIVDASAGAEFKFWPVRFLPAKQAARAGRGAYVLTECLLDRAFAGGLPHGLSWSDTRTALHRRFGKPSSAYETDGIAWSESWLLGPTGVGVRYGEGDALEIVFVYTPDGT